MPDKFFTLHELIDNLTEYLGLTPEQQFRVTAKIKRLIHAEKASVFRRYAMYSQGIGSERPKDPWLNEILEEKAEQHQQMAEEYSDEELVTWSVGAHTFVQEIPPCSKCAKVLTGNKTSYMTVFGDNTSSTFCEACAREKGLWSEE